MYSSCCVTAIKVAKCIFTSKNEKAYECFLCHNRYHVSTVPAACSRAASVSSTFVVYEYDIVVLTKQTLHRFFFHFECVNNNKSCDYISR